MSVFFKRIYKGRVGQWNVKEERINFSPSNYHQIKFHIFPLFSIPCVPFFPREKGEWGFFILSFIFSGESFCVRRCLCAMFHMTRLKELNFSLAATWRKNCSFFIMCFSTTTVRRNTQKKELYVGSLFKCMETPNKKSIIRKIVEKLRPYTEIKIKKHNNKRIKYFF